MVLDATSLLLLLNDKTSAPTPDAHERVVALVKDLASKGERVIVAAPVLAEVLVKAEAAALAYLTEMGSSANFRMVSFDSKAAVEHALYTRTAIDEGDKFGGVPESWNKVKFDRQIVAIAKAAGAHTICTDDKGLTKHAQKVGLNVLSLADVRLDIQTELDLPNIGPETAQGSSNSYENRPADQKEKGGAVVETAPPTPLSPITLLADPSIIDTESKSQAES